MVPNIITLSHIGSNIAFICNDFTSANTISPLGTWKGSVDTLLSTHNIVTNVFPIDFLLNSGEVRRVIALGCDNIGTCPGLAPAHILQLSHLFKVNCADIDNPAGLIKILIGQDSQDLLLEKATLANSKNIEDYLPTFCRDISIQISPDAQKLCFVGKIGLSKLELIFYPQI